MELGNLLFGNSRGEYEVNRDWEGAFVYKLYDMGFNSYGLPMNDEETYKGEFKTIKSEFGDTTYFENDTFILMPYYWGDDDRICELPNFVHKPTGFELSWYKYALRDSYMNQNISFDELIEIMEDCKRSLDIDDVPYQYKEAIKHVDNALDILQSENSDLTETIIEYLKKAKLLMKKW